MASARSRLTMAYAAALVATMILFAAALSTTRPSAADRVLTRPWRNADLALGILHDAWQRGELVTGTPVLVRVDSLSPYYPDTVYAMNAAVRERLDSVPDLVFVFDRDRRLLFASQRAITGHEADAPAFVAELARFGVSRDTTLALVTLDSATTLLNLGGEPVWLTARAFPDSAAPVSRVIAGVWMRPLLEGVGDLIVSILVLSVPILLLSIGGAYLIGGGALRPIEQIMGDLEAITDGRSLHRRLPVSGVPDELARLAVTLNAMLSRLETSFDALRRFTADASHELKTPLTVLRADVERAMHPSAPEGERLVALEEALHETARMADLVEGLLTLARADEGRFDIHREPIDLEPIVRDVFETAHILGEHAGLVVSLTVVEEARVMGDPVRLRQLFLNLITNAIKYTPAPGRVEISLSNRLDGVTFTVRDTGIGIAAADLPYVFERFFRADRARTRRVQGQDGTWMDGGGFGLGLAISQWIARAHGGTLTATSRLGRGSTFVVSLPTSETVEPAEERDQAEEAGRG